ncbi:MAG: hypothetical protein AB4290_12110 [Spirulina sp.]
MGWGLFWGDCDRDRTSAETAIAFGCNGDRLVKCVNSRQHPGCDRSNCEEKTG